MTKQLEPANRHRIWAFGQCYDFNIVTSTIALNQGDFKGTAANPERQQKTQIVLHCTACNNSAEGVIGWWNNPSSGDSSAHFVVERTWVRQVARPPLPDGADKQDTNLVDVVKVMDEDTITYHAGGVNSNSIGIEIVNVAWGWYATNKGRESSLAGGHPLSTCHGPINIGINTNPRWVCNHARPQDHNRFIHLSKPLDGYHDYQCYEDEQYMALILLLRHLCISHRIPRQFFGATTEEVFRHWLHEPTGNTELAQAGLRVNKSTLFHFRGIFHHYNCHVSKVCPGIVHRNRLYRGIIDEWWLPVQFDGNARNYYSGPFAIPPFQEGNQRNAYFIAGANGRIRGTVYRNADLDALTESKSYYNLNKLAEYYRQTETRQGGLFPVGTNKIWHGGVHLPVQDSNPCVYAAASGTIVAARLSSNQNTDEHADFGSQRFILIRHAVYLETEADPEGVGTRINYAGDPLYVFSLYMHLDAVANIDAEDNANPPWLNIWRRDNLDGNIGMDGEKGRVFAPNIEVSVGDILAHAARFRGRRMIHFEILTHQNAELTMAPWNDDAMRAFDNDNNAICDVRTLDTHLIDAYGDGLDVIEVLRAAPELRNVKAFHKSEWALTSADQMSEVIPIASQRQEIWLHMNRFIWIPDAVNANPVLSDQLGDQNGMFWHYHPITFMHHVNKLILGENREIREEEYEDTNVEIDEDYFFTNFIDWIPKGSRFDPANADNERIRGAYIISTDYEEKQRDSYVYHFTRQDISCRQPGNHQPGTTPPQSTKFSVALLELIERVRVHFNRSVNIELSYVCNAHGGRNSLCIMNDNDNDDNDYAMRRHREGVAVDFRPTQLTNANCRQLWNSTATIANAFDQLCQHIGTNATQADLPNGYEGVRYRTHPASVQAKLTATPQQNLTAEEIAAFRIHTELIESQITVTPADTTPLPLRLRVIFRSITVLDDKSFWGAGRWNLQCTVNDETHPLFNQRMVKRNDVIELADGLWTKEIIINPDDGEVLQIHMTGMDTAGREDSLGEVNLQYDQNSSSAWGIGTQSATSSNGSFRVKFIIELLKVKYQGYHRL